MSKPRALDLFCGEGGTTRGLQMAGWHVTGVDTKDVSDRYPGDDFSQGDALAFLTEYGHLFDAIVGGPPCQGYTIGNAANPAARGKHARLISETRWLMQITGKPWVIENVQQARSQMNDPILLCGRMFGLEALDEDGEPLVLDRHRLFESNVPMTAPPHPNHDRRQVAGVYGGGRARKPGATAAEHRWDCKHGRKGGYVPQSNAVKQTLLGIDWMTVKGMQESIPPAYGEWIGHQLAAHLMEATA